MSEQKIFKRGTRVFISPLILTGTVTGYSFGKYEVSWVDPKTQKTKSDWFAPDEVVEQLELFGGIFDV